MFFLKYGQFNDCPYLRKKVIKVLKLNVQNMINAKNRKVPISISLEAKLNSNSLSLNVSIHLLYTPYNLFKS